MSTTPRFWEHKSLHDMSDAEWEALCDGCGRCCLQKLQDQDSNDVFFTDIACRLLDADSCRCREYAERFASVPDCLSVRPLNAEKLAWLPQSCAYRRLAEGRPLASWHPLISGDPQSVRLAGISMAGATVAEQNVPLADYHEHIIHWVEP